MIRINLLTGAQPGAEAPEAVQPAPGTPKAALYLLLGAVVAIGLHYFYLQHQASDLQQQLAQQQAEAARLQIVKAQFTALLAQQSRLSGRIAIIRQLDGRRTGPYEFLVRLGGSVAGTQQIWLTACVKHGDSIAMSGRALNLYALANFIIRLRAYGFQHVRLKQAQQHSSQAHVPEYHFQLEALSLPATTRRS